MIESIFFEDKLIPIAFSRNETGAAAVIYTNYQLGYRASGVILSTASGHPNIVRLAFPSKREASILTVDRTQRDSRNNLVVEVERVFNRTLWEKFLEPRPLVEI